MVYRKSTKYCTPNLKIEFLQVSIVLNYRVRFREFEKGGIPKKQ
jgi:hypothetical protein